MRIKTGLIIPLSILITISSIVGLFNMENIYVNISDTMIPIGIGQNLFLLLIFLPLLILVSIYRNKGSIQGLLLWTGMLGYVLYTYLLFSFDLHFNSLFLIYVLLLGCSLYGFVGEFNTLVSFKTDNSRIEDVVFKKGLLIFLIVLFIVISGYWIFDVLKASILGEIPQGAKDWGTPTFGIHVIDLGIFLPGVLLTIIKLWKNQTQGILLAGVILIFLSTQGLAILTMEITELAMKQAVPLIRLIPDISLTIVCICLTLLYLKRIGTMEWKQNINATQQTI